MLSSDADELPGGSGYKDVSSIFRDGAAGILQEDMVAIKNFSLHDAMMAIEVLDPRMDSGVARPEYPQTRFDPNIQLLPEEICWIMDRMFAAEMAWHCGSALSQSVFTCLYVHELGPGGLWDRSQTISALFSPGQDPQRPLQLVSVVLRAATYGLLKCCDLAWRELMKGLVIEMEDFHGEKYDRFLCETVQVLEVVAMLDAAKLWLLSKQAASITFRAQLLARIELRRSILLVLSATLPTDVNKLHSVVRSAYVHLRDIRLSTVSFEPPKDSLALKTFDPAISRRLISVMPLKIVPLPPQEDVWESYSLFLNEIERICLLTACSSILPIKELLGLTACNHSQANRTGLLRSFGYSSLLNTRGPMWADQLFEAIANVSSNVVLTHPPVSLMQQTLKPSVDKMVQDYFASFFCNRPRQRRRLCNWMTEWASIPPMLQESMTFAESKAPADVQALKRLYLAVSVLRLTAACHIIMSGLETEIHDSREFAFVYWYGSILHRTRSDAMKELRAVCEGESEEYLASEIIWSTFLSQYMMGACMLSLLLDRDSGLSAMREQVNLRRRFKWAWKADDKPDFYAHHQHQDPCVPKLEEWATFRESQIQEEILGRVRRLENIYRKLDATTAAYEEVTESEMTHRPSSIGTGEDSPSKPTQMRLNNSSLHDRSNQQRLELLGEMRGSASTNMEKLSSVIEGYTQNGSVKLPELRHGLGQGQWFPFVE